MIETMFAQDIKKAVKVHYLDGNVFSLDNNGNKVGVYLYESGEPVAVTGNISANVIRSDGATVSISGNSDANAAWVVLPQSALAVPGLVSVIIKTTSGSDITTLCAVVGNVYASSTDTVVDPGTIIPSIETLIAAIDTAVASIPADYSSLWTSLAPAFSSDAAYKDGQYVTYNGGLYKFKYDYSGSWSSAAVDSVNIGNEINVAFTDYEDNVGGFEKDYFGFAEASNSGIKYQYDIQHRAYHVTGALTSSKSIRNILPRIKTRVEGGKDYALYIDKPENSTLTVEVFFYGYNSSTQIGSTLTLSDPINIFTTPATAGNMLARFAYTDTAQKDEYVNLWCSEVGNKSLVANVAQLNYGALPSGTNLNSLVNTSGNWLLNSAYSYTNAPVTAGFLRVQAVGRWTLQQCYNLTVTKLYTRRANASGTFGDWEEIQGGGGSVTYENNYITNSYSTTLNATVTPTITTDSNQYLAASGDDTDRAADIETLLTNTGVCRLGPGDFYVTGIDMPAYSSLFGSGRTTRIILLGSNSTEGYAIHLNNYCTVRDMRIYGSTTALNISTFNYVNRHGILFEATYNADSSTKRKCIVDGVQIHNFTGGGITMYNTGYTVNSTLMVTNCYVQRCMVGYNIYYFSEFNNITSSNAVECYYGCLNNGGNNLIIGCNFSDNVVGMYFDNSTGQSNNNTHGSVIGCIFDHENNNTGTGIKMDGCENGQIFSDCQLFYAGIDINNCSGVQINNLNVGGSSANSISVTKGTAGGLVIFNNCVFKDGSYNIATDYNNVKFVNCWTRTGVAVP